MSETCRESPASDAEVDRQPSPRCAEGGNQASPSTRPSTAGSRSEAGIRYTPRVLPPLQYSALGLETFRDDVLLPAVTLARAPLDVSVWHPAAGSHPSANAIASTSQRPPPGRRRSGKDVFRPVALGYRWGPVWSTAWFRVRGRIPAAMAGQQVALRFSSGTEATLWLDGRPFQGFDPYRDLATVWPKAKAGESVDLLIEAACNLPLGISTFWWDHAELHAKWKEAKPGRLESCELVVVDDVCWRFAERWDFLRKTLLVLPADSPRAIAINDGMRDMLKRIASGDPRRGMRAETNCLDGLIRGAGTPTSTVCVAVGHAHIDTAWLWPVCETRRKCLRTFASVLRLIDRFDAFHFICSQAQQYAWVEEDSPKLFAEITRRVRSGRFEPTGAMWIEPDCTCPSGESFVRQILHGIGYWAKRFGAAAPQRMLYLPDTFGFPPCLPQIARLAGLDTFITNKMSWCESNRFPHVTFRWCGLDGTEVLTHLTPGHNYNSSIEPADMLYGERMLVAQDGQSFAGRAIPTWLQPYGFGDGGGGPTAQQIERANAASRCEGLPAFEQHSVHQFCQRLHDGRAELRAHGRDVHAWDGELYLELHRGTYTSQAWIKRQNRLAESLLRDVEATVCSLPKEHARLRDGTRAWLDPLWKLVLLNQFHDILPGSSIAAVYEDARTDHERVANEGGVARDSLLATLSMHCDTREMTAPLLVRNPASTDRGGVVELDGRLFAVDAVPALGFEIVDGGADPLPGPPVEVKRLKRTARGVAGGVTLQNAWIDATIDGAGRIAELRAHGTLRSANARDERGQPQALNQLWLYDDRPRRWEAWDVDRDYMERGIPIDGPADVEIVTAHPLRSEVRVTRRIGRASHLTQTYRLDAGSRRLDVRTFVDWQEERTMLRALFPVNVRTRTATFGTQFGVLERSTHRNTSWDEARFEVPGHAWMDLSEPGFGLAVLDDGKYGRSAIGSVLGLSLLRSPCFPDSSADRGEHSFTYALMPHDGDWRAAGVDSEAEALREPLRATRLTAGRRGALHGSFAPFRVSASHNVALQIAAWKPSETGRSRILRLVETRGGRGEVCVRWSEATTSVVPVDLLERPFAAISEMGGSMESDPGPPTGFVHDRRKSESRFEIRPFQIVSFLVRDR